MLADVSPSRVAAVRCAMDSAELRKKHRDARKAAGLCVQCGAERGAGDSQYCQKHREAMRASWLKHYNTKAKGDIRKKTQRRDRAYRNFYGITLLEYEALLVQQAGGCAICGKEPPKRGRVQRLVVDHDHETGQVRGLLCDTCNRAIGLLGDNATMLRRACEYLSRPRNER
jgi:hypothetical protein